MARQEKSLAVCLEMLQDYTAKDFSLFAVLTTADFYSHNSQFHFLSHNPNDMSNKYNEKQRDSDCRAPVFALADAVSDSRKIRVCVWFQCAFPCFLSGEEGGGRRFFVNEGEHAGGREAARGLAVGVSFGLQYAE